MHKLAFHPKKPHHGTAAVSPLFLALTLLCSYPPQYEGAVKTANDLSSVGRRLDATTAFVRVIDQWPDHAPAYYNLAQARVLRSPRLTGSPGLRGPVRPNQC